jgi:geranyl-CoA carboxylase beta subunit
MVGKAYEQAGMIKHGSKMIQAVTNATVPQHHADVRRQFGAGNYGMCGRGLRPALRVLLAQRRTAVMGGEQAATVTMRIVTEVDPRDTRQVLAATLAICREGRARSLRPSSFGVARM